MKKILSLALFALILISASVPLTSCGAGGADSPVVGRWKTRVPLAKILDGGDAEGYADLGVDLKDYDLELTFAFRENGKADVGINSKAAKETLTELFGKVVEKGAEAAAKTADEYAASMGYASKEDAVKSMIRSADFSGFGATYSYSTDDKTLDIAGCKVEFIPGDEIVLVSADASGAEEDAPKYLERVLPLTLTKQ